MAAQNQDMHHFSICLPLNDICTAEPQTIIYSSSHRSAVYDAKMKANPSQSLPAITTAFPPTKRFRAPMKEVQEFVTRFSTYGMCRAELQVGNPYPTRPASSSSQHNDNDRGPTSSYNIYLYAPGPSLKRARGEILQHLQLHHQTFLSASRDLLLSDKNTLPPAYADEFDKIAIESIVEIIIALPSNQNFTIFSNSTRYTTALQRGYLDGIGEIKEGSEDVIIVMNGSLPSLESARIKIRVLLDRIRGDVCEVIEGITHSTHPLIAGRRRSELEEKIEKAYNVNIYMHAPTAKVFKEDREVQRHYDRIYVTGDKADVQKAIASLQSRITTFMTMTKEVVLSSSKIDWIITEKLEKLRQIMDEDATFIDLPPLGSDSTRITVSGTTLPLIERSIRRMNKLISDYFEFTYWIFPPDLPNVILKPPCDLAQLAWHTGAEVNFLATRVEVNGNEPAIRTLLHMLLHREVSFYPEFNATIRIRCEMASELREFVSGKKLGKVNKIIKSANCNISFGEHSEYNFHIDITSAGLREIADGYTQLLEEFPAELYWFVPEEYHKRIIGVQGKTIQRIMKHYSVYVKFFNALEFASAGGDSKTEDNVLARTPAKNAHALENCKKAVLEMVFQNDKDYITETVDVPKQYHVFLQKQCQTQVQDIGKNSGATIRFPEANTPLEAVAITAAPTRIKDVAKALLNLVPMTFTIVSEDPKLVSLTESSDYHYSVSDQLKIVYHIELATEHNTDDTVNPPKKSVVFKFQYIRPNLDKLKEAIGHLCSYVNTKGVTLERVNPPEPREPETKPFDQEKSNFYGQNSVTQPYHTPAQIAAAAQGTLPLYQLNNHGFHQNGGFQHHNSGAMNGYHGHPGQSYGRGGYQSVPSSSFGLNRSMNMGRAGHHNLHSPSPGYQNGIPPFQIPGRGNLPNHGHFNPSYGPAMGSANGPMNGNNGYPRGRYVNTPPTPSSDSHLSGSGNLNYQSHPRSGAIATGMVVQSPLDTLPSLELPEVGNPANVNSGDFRVSQDGHTPISSAAFSPPNQSYFPPQQSQPPPNNFPPGPGYAAGSTGPRYQG